MKGEGKKDALWIANCKLSICHVYMSHRASGRVAKECSTCFPLSVAAREHQTPVDMIGYFWLAQNAAWQQFAPHKYGAFWAS